MTISRFAKIFNNLNRIGEVYDCLRTTKQWIPLTLAYIGICSLTYPYKVFLNNNSCITLTDFFDLTTFWSIFFGNAYPVCASDKVIVDAGANFGAFTLFASRAAREARIIAIEPFPATFTRLLSTICDNYLSERVLPVQAGLGKESCTAQMISIDQPSQFRSIEYTHSAQNVLSVNVLTLGDVFHNTGIEKVDLLKMDIEGGEYKSLLFADPDTLNRIDRICLEYHPVSQNDSCTTNELFVHLQESGFQMSFYRNDGNGYGIIHFDRKCFGK